MNALAKKAIDKTVSFLLEHLKQIGKDEIRDNFSRRLMYNISSNNAVRNFINKRILEHTDKETFPEFIDSVVALQFKAIEKFKGLTTTLVWNKDEDNQVLMVIYTDYNSGGLLMFEFDENLDGIKFVDNKHLKCGSLNFVEFEWR